MSPPRRAWIIGVACVAAVVVAVLVGSREQQREPEYEGVKLSDWMLGSVRSHPSKKYIGYVLGTADKAIEHAGTNAYPLLLKWLSYESPAWKQRMSQFITNFPAAAVNSRLAAWLVDERKLRLAWATQKHLSHCGSEIVPYLKAIVRIEAEHKHAQASRRAWSERSCWPMGGRPRSERSTF
jgi:hypothetical protein